MWGRRAVVLRRASTWPTCELLVDMDVDSMRQPVEDSDHGGDTKMLKGKWVTQERGPAGMAPIGDVGVVGLINPKTAFVTRNWSCRRVSSVSNPSPIPLLALEIRVRSKCR